MKRNDLVKRALSGIVLVAVIVGCVLLSPYARAVLFTVMAGGGLLEFLRLAGTRKGVRPLPLYAVCMSAAVMAVAFLHAEGSAAGLLPLLGVALVFLVRGAAQLYVRDADPFPTLGAEAFGLFYTTFPMALLLYLPEQAVLFLLIVIWLNDVGAYLVGSAFGKRPLFPRISPKKSWEGFFGGLAAAGLFSALTGYYLFGAWGPWLALGLVTAAAGVFGDLFESLFKRTAGVKDSGSLIPGHGGFLDRFDALFFAAPFFFALYYLLFR